jgi:hypothetical protein
MRVRIWYASSLKLSANAEGACFVFIVTIVLFLLPSSLLWAAWTGSARSAREGRVQDWRAYCSTAALVTASCATLLELAFFFSWFHNGGSPHGMMPSPGLWKFLGKIAACVLVASIVLSAFGKGKWRLLILGWAASLILVAYAISMLDRD